MTLGLLAGPEPGDVRFWVTKGESARDKCWACQQPLAEGQPPSWHIDPETGDYTCLMREGP